MALEHPLTGLPNRSWLEVQLDEWTRTPVERGVALALLVIRLDRFLQLNEQLPGIGDQVMRAMATRLREAIRAPAQMLCLSRGQFAVTISTIRTPETAAECTRLIARILRPPVGGPKTLTCTAGIGIALMPEDASTVESVVAAAESAASYACAKGGDRIEFYRHEMTREIAQEHALERNLRMALTHGELAVAYQPKFSVQGTAVTGFEALVRWHHPLAGAIAPDHPTGRVNGSDRLLGYLDAALRQSENTGVAKRGPGERAGNSERFGAAASARQFCGSGTRRIAGPQHQAGMAGT